MPAGVALGSDGATGDVDRAAKQAPTLAIYFSHCVHKAAQNRVSKGHFLAFSVLRSPLLSWCRWPRLAKLALCAFRGKQATCAQKHNRKALGLPVGL